MFKRQLHLHHTGEDRHIWPRLGERLAHSESAMSTLQAMEEEHARVDPLLDAVDAAFADPAGDRLAAPSTSSSPPCTAISRTRSGTRCR